MKKLFFIAIILLLSTALHAQDHGLLERILKANSAASSIESDLTETVVKQGKATTHQGKLYFVKPDQFAALFNNERYMISNVDRLKMDIGMFHGKFKLRKSGMMRSLSNIFLYGFQGRCQDLANENNYTLEFKEDGPYQLAVFTSKKRSIIGIGYKQVIYKFEKDSLKLKEIHLFDNREGINMYSISNIEYDVAVDQGKFEF